MRTSRASDLTAGLAEQVRAAADARSPLRIIGGDTRAAYGRKIEGAPLRMAGHTGVVAYDPSELVLTARAGTPVSEIEAVLAENNQMLAFEPPVFGPSSTLGGTIAAGLSGPRRPFVGALRDYVLGAQVMDGRGQVLNFGGAVFKNVAGFDAFRLMAGALGCLGVILQASLRVAPKPRAEIALAYDLDSRAAQDWVTRLMRRPLPLSGAFHDGQKLHLRFSGGEAAVAAAASEFGGEPESLDLWTQVRDLTHPALAAPVLWRLSLPAASRLATPPAAWDWGGAQAWRTADTIDPKVWDEAAALGGHATLMRGAVDQVFQPLPTPMLALHQRIKAGLDPAGVFNPGRMYEGL